MSIKDQIRIDAKALNKQIAKVSRIEANLIPEVGAVVKWLRFERNKSTRYATSAGNFSASTKGMTPQQMIWYRDLLMSMRQKIGTVASRRGEIEILKADLKDDFGDAVNDIDRLNNAYDLYNYISDNYPRITELMGSDELQQYCINLVDDGISKKKMIERLEYLELYGTDEQIYQEIIGRWQ